MRPLRAALRSLVAAPTVSALVLVCLALGIGANTALFAIFDALTLRPLPIPDPDRLALVTIPGRPTSSWPQPVWLELRDRGVLPDAFAWYWTRFDAAERGQRQYIDGMVATGGSFASLGIQPLLGRMLMPADDALDDGPDGRACVIAYGFWQARLGGDAHVLGRSLWLDGHRFTIVGVTPPGFAGLDAGLPFEVAIPLGAAASAADPWVTIMARLTAGQSPDVLTAALRAVQPRIRQRTNPYDVSPYREQYLQEPFTVRSAPAGISFLSRRYGSALRVLQAIAGVVLLIACGNVAMLLMARTIRRRYELGVRAALGATRARLAGTLLIESLILSAGGAVLGLVIGRWSSALLVSQLSTQAYTVALNPSASWRVMACAAALASLTAIIAGLAPMIRAGRTNPVDSLRLRGSSPPFGLGSAVIVAQVALALTLLVGAGLLLRTFRTLSSLDLGFDRDRIVVATIEPGHRLTTESAHRAFLATLAAEMTASPDAESAALSLAVPGGNSALTPWVRRADGVALPQGDEGVYANRVGVGWFRTLGTRVLAGREFTSHDDAGAPAVAIVNEAFATRFLTGNPLGQVVAEGGGPDDPGRPLEIVGVVEDAMYRFVREAPPPTIYTPLAQDPTAPASIFVSVRARPGTRDALMREVVLATGRADPEALVTVRSLAGQVESQYGQERLAAGLATAFGTLAAVLAALGLYGVAAYGVTRRRAEIGVRLALGATPFQVLCLVLVHVAVLTAVGGAIGVLGGLWAGHVERSLLYHIAPSDAGTLAAAGVLLLAVCLAGAALAARRAAAVDPASLLRDL